ncbi:MAG: hypothetical protein WCJ45_07600 [bacterium]
MSDNYTNEAWVAKYDISSYFMSINKTILSGLVRNILETNKSHLPYSIQRFWKIISTIIMDEPTMHYHRIGNIRQRDSFPKHKSLFASKIGTGLPL